MVSEEKLKSEDHAWFFDKIKNLLEHHFTSEKRILKNRLL